MVPVLGYWDIRGLGEPIRFLLHYAGQGFEDKRYVLGPDMEAPNDWFGKDREKMDLLLPNLPYYIDDKVKLTQSGVIIRYLAYKLDLAPRNMDEQLISEHLEGHFYDFKIDLACFAYFNPDWKELMAEHFERVPAKISCLENILSDNRQWFLGDWVTYVDFLAYDSLDFERVLKSDCFDAFPKILAFMKRFEDLPQIRRYMESGKYPRTALFAPLASVGNKKG